MDSGVVVRSSLWMQRLLVLQNSLRRHLFSQRIQINMLGKNWGHVLNSSDRRPIALDAVPRFITPKKLWPQVQNGISLASVAATAALALT